MILLTLCVFIMLRHVPLYGVSAASLYFIPEAQ